MLLGKYVDRLQGGAECEVGVQHRVVFGTLEAVRHVLAARGWKMNTSFVERLNLDIRQRVAAVGRRVNTLGQSEDSVQPQLVLFHVYDNFVLPHTSLRQPLLALEATNRRGSARVWQPWTPAMAAGLTDHVWTLRTMPSQCLSIDNSNDRAAHGVSSAVLAHLE